jgi:RsiW-degrading membrane proteinase PrsW (M82 family)
MLAGYGLRWYLVRAAGAPLNPQRRSVLTHTPWLYPTCLVVGGLGGAVFGVVITPTFENALGPLTDTIGARILRDAVAVALSEEIGKGLLLFGLYATGRIRTPLDGLILGVAAGTGFATIENWFYFISAWANEGADAWWTSVRVRIGLSTWIHGAASATLGAYLGAAARHGRRDVRLAAPLAGLAAAWGIHGAWNGLLACSIPPGSAVFAAVALLVPLASTGALTAIVANALRDRHRINPRRLDPTGARTSASSSAGRID